MFLVHEKKEQTGKWEIAWMWLPHFLASDASLHKHVGQMMTEKFKGATVEDDPGMKNTLMMEMHNEVVKLITERHPIPGLRQHLESLIHIHPDGEET